jgi:hypothetical protein
VIEILAQIRAPKFTAGLVLRNGHVIETAPIISYMKRGRWTRERVREYCKAQGWSVVVIHEVRSSDSAEAAEKS